MNKSTAFVVCGNKGATHLGESLARAAQRAAIPVSFCDARLAQSGWRPLNSLAWRFCGHKQPYPERLAARLISAVRTFSPCTLLTTGMSMVEAKTVERCRQLGAIALHFSTDDPWNDAHRAEWLLEALPHYDIVFTPRTANLEDLRGLGCIDVRYMPFGYDAELFEKPAIYSHSGIDCLFVGGADPDRRSFFEQFRLPDVSLALVGGYWDRYPETRSSALGLRSPREVIELSLSAKVNLILVRRANRDGHTMRTFEAGAIGGCLAVEDTPDHRTIFGVDGEAVRYFRTPAEATQVCLELLSDLAERSRLAAAVKQRIRTGGHTYADRLKSMIEVASGNQALNGSEQAHG